MQTQYGGRGGGHSAVRPDVCERTPGCTRGYKHGGAGGRCSFSAPPGERRPPASSSSEGGAAPPRRKKNAPTGKRKVAKHLLAAQAAAVAEREGAAAVAVPRPKKRRSGSRKKRLASGAAGADLSEIFHRPRCSRVADGCQSLATRRSDPLFLPPRPRPRRPPNCGTCGLRSVVCGGGGGVPSSHLPLAAPWPLPPPPCRLTPRSSPTPPHRSRRFPPRGRHQQHCGRGGSPAGPRVVSSPASPVQAATARSPRKDRRGSTSSRRSPTKPEACRPRDGQRWPEMTRE